MSETPNIEPHSDSKPRVPTTAEFAATARDVLEGDNVQVQELRRQRIKDIEQACLDYAQLSDITTTNLGGPASLEFSQKAEAAQLNRLTELLPDKIKVALIDKGLAATVGRQVSLAREADTIRANLKENPGHYRLDGGVHQVALSKGEKAKATLEGFWNGFGDVV